MSLHFCSEIYDECYNGLEELKVMCDLFHISSLVRNIHLNSDKNTFLAGPLHQSPFVQTYMHERTCMHVICAGKQLV